MNDKKIVAIHQPNFFPWLGFFDKISRADIFILLDHVQIPKTGGTWTNRVKLLFSDGKPRWVTVPIKRTHHGVQQVNEIQINYSTDWQKQMLKTLWANYSKTPHYHDILTLLEPMILKDTENLAEFNISIIDELIRKLRLSSRLVRSSELQVQGTSNELLISLVQSVGGTAYLCGGGASEYMDNTKYTAASVDLIYQNFRHPVYPQKNSGEFVPGLSIIDALMNIGIDGVRSLLKK
jgi:hypothetical protein